VRGKKGRAKDDTERKKQRIPTAERNSFKKAERTGKNLRRPNFWQLTNEGESAREVNFRFLVRENQQNTKKRRDRES